MRSNFLPQSKLLFTAITCLLMLPEHSQPTKLQHIFLSVPVVAQLLLPRCTGPSIPYIPIQAFPPITFTFNTCFTNLQGNTIFLITITTFKHIHTSRVKVSAIINFV